MFYIDSQVCKGKIWGGLFFCTILKRYVRLTVKSSPSMKPVLGLRSKKKKDTTKVFKGAKAIQISRYKKV